MAGEPLPDDWLERAERDYVADYGQISPEGVKALNKAVREGMLVRYRGHWDTGEDWGMGPLKTCWRRTQP